MENILKKKEKTEENEIEQQQKIETSLEQIRKVKEKLLLTKHLLEKERSSGDFGFKFLAFPK
jgi:hypothetical protein